MVFNLQIDKQGRILLPKVLLDAAGIRPGSNVFVEPTERGLLITRVGGEHVRKRDKGL